jgi:hypothetical protein
MNDDQIKVAVRALLMDLPDSLHGYFLDHDQLHKIMTRGGFPGPPWDKVCSAALGWRRVPRIDYRINCTIALVRGTLEKAKFACNKDQRDSNIDIPRVHPNYILRVNPPPLAKAAADVLIAAAGYGAAQPGSEEMWQHQTHNNEITEQTTRRRQSDEAS